MMDQNDTKENADPSTQGMHRPVIFCLHGSDLNGNLYDITLLWLIIAIQMTVSTIAIPLNTVVIIAVKQRKELQKNLNIMLSSMAVADLLVCVTYISMSFNVVLLIIRQVSPEHFCMFNSISVNLVACFIFSSLYHLMVIAWERYVAVRKWKEYKVIVTKRQLTYLAIFAWLAAIMTTFPVLIMKTVGVNINLLKTWILLANVCGAVTFLAIVYFYIMVYLGVRKQKTSERSQVRATVHVQAKLQSKVAMTTGLITLALLITTVLAFFFLGLRIIFPAFHTLLLFLISGTLFQSNSLINPLLYCYRDRRFRRAALELLRIGKPSAIHPTDGAVQFRKLQHQFGAQERAQENVQQELKIEEKRSRLTRSTSLEPLVGLTDEVMLKRSMSAPSLVKFSSVFDELQLQKPSSVLVTTVEIHAENSVRCQTRTNKSKSPRKGVGRSERLNFCDASVTNDFCSVQFLLRKEKMFQRPRTAPCFPGSPRRILLSKPARSYSWDATVTDDFSSVQRVQRRKQKIFQRPKTGQCIS